MSGGRLVVLDRQGRDVKQYPLPDGLATLGSDPACDIRVMLPSVSPHHANVVVHANQTVVRNMGDSDTLVNGEPVSIVALRHGDVITLGDRSLRWEYTNPDVRRHRYIEPVVFLSRVSTRGDSRRGRRATAAGGARHRALQLHHRASMPASTGGKQVAIVQPQRRDTNEQNEKTPPQPQSTQRPRSNADTSIEEDKSKRKSTSRVSPKNLLQTTKATLWIESRKTSPRKSAKSRSPSPRKSAKVQTPPPRPNVGVRRVVSAKKSTPLRMAVLKRAQSAHKLRVTKIEAPVKIDHTKQAAIMLMTGHTPKQKVPTPKPKTPSYVVKKPSPVRKTPRGRPAKRSKENVTPLGVTPKRTSTYEQKSTRKSKRTSDNQSVPVLEITDTDAQNATGLVANESRRSGRKSLQKSPRLPSPKKSALKDPKKNKRKTESIKFDLSNLESMQDSNDVLMISDAHQQSEDDESISEDEFTLRYSDNSSTPSPRKSIHSRSSRILEKTIGSPMSLSPNRTQPSEYPRGRKSLRSSLIVQKALENDSVRKSSQSFDQSAKSVASPFKTHTLSPRKSQNIESYSIVDLVSIDSNNESPRTSIYNSAESNATFDVINTTGRKTRSTIDPTLLGSSTPYVGRKGRQSVPSQNSTIVNETQSSPAVLQVSTRANADSVATRRTKSLSTPENTQKHISVNSTKISRISRSRSRLNDSDLLLIDDDESDASPKTSKRGTRASKSILSESFTYIDQNSVSSVSDVSPSHNGVTTPEKRHSPQHVGTPVLSIQSLLDSSQNSFTSLTTKKSRVSQRKTIGVISDNKRGRASFKSKSLNLPSRRTTSRLRQNSSEGSDKTDEGALQPDKEEIVTPKSAVKLVHEGVKNKHSTAKKPQSKRSIIDDLNQSDIVKQLFNSPVKRKLSQSMTEFSRKQLFEDDDEVVLTKRPTRNTVALTGRTPEYSILDQTEAISPEVFVSPMNTPSVSPNLEGIKRLFRKNTPRNDLANVKGVKNLYRTPKARRSCRNDLTTVSGVKAVFAKSPRNRLSDVAVRDLFVQSPNNGLRKVSGVKSLFQSQKKNQEPKNDLSDVRGVKSLFRKSPANDLRNVSGVKKILRKTSPRNDLSDVRGVKKMFKESKKQTDDCDVSGIEELFDESNRDTDSVFDQLVGKPPIKAVYSKTFSGKSIQKAKNRKGRSLHTSIDTITNNVEEWLEQELNKRLHKDTSKLSVTRELKKIATDTVEGTTPIRNSRVRDSTLLKVTQGEYERKKSASEIYSARKLPIKKRSLVELSMERSRKEDGQKSILPIKKRLVVHSTPVKGRDNLTMNASELGRVSPIVPDRTRADGPDTTTVEILEVPQHKRKGRYTKLITTVKENEVSMSPKKTRAKAKAGSKATPKAIATRSRRDKKDLDKTKSQVALVDFKILPVKVASKSSRSKKDAKASTTKNLEKSPNSPKISTWRQKRAENLEPKITPKRPTRARVQKSSVVVTKPSPQLKPRSVRNVGKEVNKSKDTKQVKKDTRKTEIVLKVADESAIESQAPKRRTRATVVTEPKTKGRKSDNPKGQKQKLPEEILPTKRGRKTNAQNVIAEEKKQSPVKETLVKTRGKTKATETNTSKRTNKTVVEKSTKTKVLPEKNESPVKGLSKITRGRGKKLQPQESVQSEPTRQPRRRKVDNTVIPEEKGRKRKTTTEDTIPSKVTRGRKKTIETTVTETANGRQKRSVVKDNKVEISKSTQEGEVNKVTRVVRSRKVVEEITALQPAEQASRGRKRTTTVENAPDNKRTKKSKPEMSPAKEAVKKQPSRKKANSAKASVSVVASPLKTRGKSMRGKNEPEVSKKPVGRSRRR